MAWRSSHSSPRKRSRSPTGLSKPDLAACRKIEKEFVQEGLLVTDFHLPIFSTFLAPSGKFYGKTEEDHVDAAAMINQRPVTLQDSGFVRAYRNNVGDVFGIEFKTRPTKAQMESLEKYFAAFPEYHVHVWSKFDPAAQGWHSYDSFDDFKSYLRDMQA